MMYGRSSIRSYIPPNAACKGHFAPKWDDTKTKHPITGKVHPSISCVACQPFLDKDPEWAMYLRDVPLTEEEELEVEARKQQALERQTLVTDAVGQVLEKLVGTEEVKKVAKKASAKVKANS